MACLSFFLSCLPTDRAARRKTAAPAEPRHGCHELPQLSQLHERQPAQVWSGQPQPYSGCQYNRGQSHQHSPQNDRKYLPYRPGVSYPAPLLNFSKHLPSPPRHCPPAQATTAATESEGRQRAAVPPAPTSLRHAPADPAPVSRLERMPGHRNLRGIMARESGLPGIPWPAPSEAWLAPLTSTTPLEPTVPPLAVRSPTRLARDHRREPQASVCSTPSSLRQSRVSASPNTRFYVAHNDRDGRCSSSRNSTSSFSSTSSCSSATSTRAVCDVAPYRRLQETSRAPPSARQRPPQTPLRIADSAPSTRHLSFAQRAALAMAQAECPPSLDDLPLPLPRFPGVSGAGRRNLLEYSRWTRPGSSRLANINEASEA